MPEILRQPENLNYLSPLNFAFHIKRMPTVNFMCTKVALPTISLGVAQVGSPFKITGFTGDKPTYGDLSVTFKMDEDGTNYLEVFNWLVGVGFPKDFTQYAAVARNSIASGQGVYSDATVTIMNSALNPNIEFTFEDMFPTSISAPDLDVSGTDVQYVEITATFHYNMFTVRKI